MPQSVSRLLVVKKIRMIILSILISGGMGVIFPAKAGTTCRTYCQNFAGFKTCQTIC